jgi:hypothetical protein
MVPKVWDEYRVLIEDTQQVSARRQSGDNVYLAANSVILGAVGVLIAQGALHNVMMLAAMVALACAGLAIVREWARQDRIFIKYLAFRYDLLKEMEADGRIPVAIFQLEEGMYDKKKGKGPSMTHFGFSQSAARVLPGTFGFLYGLGILGIAAVLTFVALTGQWAAWGLVWPH